MNCKLFLIAAVAALTAGGALTAPAAVNIRIQADQPGAAISPTLWGIFFEDINYGADGGLYPERVKNRSFEFPSPLMGWHVEAQAGVGVLVGTEPAHGVNNRHFLRVTNGGTAAVVLRNEGFFGMGIQQGQEYEFSLQARCVGRERPTLAFTLTGADGRHLAGGSLKGMGNEWKRLAVTVRAGATDLKAHLSILVKGPGSVDLDLISLMPRKTFKNHGLREDMAQMLAELKPGFLRFPGGCIVEGRWLTNRYQWKTTIGPVAERRLIINRWNDEFKHRPAPDYYQSFGLGFFEYFQLCEDIGAEPLPILNCGMACQFNSGELAPMDQLQEYIQDALDLIEFANGPVSSPWGKKRAEMGHPKPFRLKYLGIGNEQWLQPYIDRYAAFARVLKARHPEIQLVSSAGPAPDDEKFRFAWPKLRELKADIVDEHCYARPEWFLNNAHRYDGYDRRGPRVFMGEYAAQSDKTVSVNNRNNWECALAEAAYMTGLERNADVVVMASYAPLFGHEEGWQWRPNLIWCDNLRSYGTPSYYVQQMFSLNKGDRTVPLLLEGVVPTEGGKPRFYATAARDTRTGEIILKVVNATPGAVEAQLTLEGVAWGRGRARVTVLTGGLKDENSIEFPTRVAPVTSTLPLGALAGPFSFWKHSLTVLRVPIR